MKPIEFIKDLLFGQQAKDPPKPCCNIPSSHNARLYVNEELFNCQKVQFFQRSNGGYGELTFVILDTEYQKLINKKVKLSLVVDINGKATILYSARVKFDSNESLKVSVDDTTLVAILGFVVLERDLGNAPTELLQSS